MKSENFPVSKNERYNSSGCTAILLLEEALEAVQECGLVFDCGRTAVPWICKRNAVK